MMQQAHIHDPMQAAKIRLAIRWGVNPDTVSDRRVRQWVARQMQEQQEEVLLWLDRRPS